MAITSFFRLATAIALSLCYITVQIECEQETLANHNPPPTNFRPIIGILAQSMVPYTEGTNGPVYNEFISSSYVKFIEGGGARVVPIRLRQSEEYYKHLMSQINGILFPGVKGVVNLNFFRKSSLIIRKIADEFNDGGQYFPLWSMIQGFPVLINTIPELKHRQRRCPIEDQFSYNRSKINRRSRMFKNVPSDVFKYIGKPQHRTCITFETFFDSNLNKDYRFLYSTTHADGVKLISDVEHLHKPYYNTQLDPHNVIYDWAHDRTNRNGFKFIRSGQYLANWFVNEARRNNNRFPDANEESKHLIYNYNRIFKDCDENKCSSFYYF